MFTTIFIQPLYNILVWLIALFGGHIGWAVVTITILVKLILSPLAYRALRVQIAQKKIAPKLEEIKKQYPDKTEQTKKIMELYKETGSNPFSGCLLILIQIPIIIALYQVFLKGIYVGNPLLYTGIQVPETIHTMFLGIDLGVKSLVLALFAGITQYIQIHFSPAMQKDPDTVINPDDTQANMMQSMNSSMKWTMPVMIGFFAYMVPGAVALYWVITNLFTIGQEYITGKMLVK